MSISIVLCCDWEGLDTTLLAEGGVTEIENKELIGITIIIESSKDEHLGGMNHSSVSPSSLCCFSFRNNFLLSPSNFSVVREKNELAGGENESKQ